MTKKLFLLAIFTQQIVTSSTTLTIARSLQMNVLSSTKTTNTIINVFTSIDGVSVIDSDTILVTTTAEANTAEAVYKCTEDGQTNISTPEGSSGSREVTQLIQIAQQSITIPQVGVIRASKQ